MLAQRKIMLNGKMRIVSAIYQHHRLSCCGYLR